MMRSLHKIALLVSMLLLTISSLTAADRYLLTPETAEINGPRLRYCDKGYIENWMSTTCYPEWEITTTKTEKLNCFVEAGCGKGHGGNVELIIDGESKQTFDVVSVGHWNSYKIYNIGSVTLKPGKHTVRVKAKKLNGKWLMHLRGVLLTTQTSVDSMK